MLGAIIGDIVGSRFESAPLHAPSFELFTPECSFTDDTICTIAIADAVLHNADYQSTLRKWCRRYPNPAGGYGAMFHQWLLSESPKPYGSCGNGSAMRVSSIGWLFDDIRQVLDEAGKSAAFTHNHPEGIKGARCIASLIFNLRSCRESKDSLLNNIHKHYDYHIPSLQEVNRFGRSGHFDATCQETVPMAISCFLESTDFENAIRLAMMARGDTDTKGAIVGSLAEAFYEIPGWMANKAYEYLPEEMIDVLREFYDQSARRLG